MNTPFEFDLGDDLVFTKVQRRTTSGGAWVSGTLHGHRFDALVFEGHAENAEWEYAQSRISKLWVQRLADKATVFNWDRGLDVAATTDLAQAIVDFLAADWQTTSLRPKPKRGSVPRRSTVVGRA